MIIVQRSIINWTNEVRYNKHNRNNLLNGCMVMVWYGMREKHTLDSRFIKTAAFVASLARLSSTSVTASRNKNKGNKHTFIRDVPQARIPKKKEKNNKNAN